MPSTHKQVRTRTTAGSQVLTLPPPDPLSPHGIDRTRQELGGTFGRVQRRPLSGANRLADPTAHRRGFCGSQTVRFAHNDVPGLRCHRAGLESLHPPKRIMSRE